MRVRFLLTVLMVLLGQVTNAAELRPADTQYLWSQLKPQAESADYENCIKTSDGNGNIILDQPQNLDSTLDKKISALASLTTLINDKSSHYQHRGVAGGVYRELVAYRTEDADSIQITFDALFKVIPWKIDAIKYYLTKEGNQLTRVVQLKCSNPSEDYAGGKTYCARYEIVGDCRVK